jgi:hypothetical protein
LGLDLTTLIPAGGDDTETMPPGLVHINVILGISENKFIGFRENVSKRIFYFWRVPDARNRRPSSDFERTHSCSQNDAPKKYWMKPFVSFLPLSHQEKNLETGT